MISRSVLSFSLLSLFSVWNPRGSAFGLVGLIVCVCFSHFLHLFTRWNFILEQDEQTINLFMYIRLWNTEYLVPNVYRIAGLFVHAIRTCRGKCLDDYPGNGRFSIQTQKSATTIDLRKINRSLQQFTYTYELKRQKRNRQLRDSNSGPRRDSLSRRAP